MLLTPKRRKHRKRFVKWLKGKSTRGSSISFGDYGMKATTSWYVSNRQLEAARKVIIRRVKKVGKIWIRIFPDVPITKKWLEMPMGKGKGDVDIYKAAVRKGRVLFEVSGVDKETAEDMMIRAGKKLPIKVRMVEKGEVR